MTFFLGRKTWKCPLKSAESLLKIFSVYSFQMEKIWKVLNLEFLASNVKEGKGEVPSAPVPICSAGWPVIPTGPEECLRCETQCYDQDSAWETGMTGHPNSPLSYIGQIPFWARRARFIASLGVTSFISLIMLPPRFAMPGRESVLLPTLLWVLRQTATQSYQPHLDPTQSPYGIHMLLLYEFHFDSLKCTSIMWRENSEVWEFLI